MTAQQLKNSILQMAVQGKLVPQDPNDEPASVLLERIKAEKQELIKAGKIKKDKKTSEIFRGASRNLPYAFCEQIGKEIRDISDEVPFEIPDSWEWVRLGQIGETNIGLTYRPSDKTTSGGTLVLRSSNIQNDKMAYNDNVYVSCDIPERAMIHKGDILICARNGSRALVGKCAIVDKDGMAFGAFMAKFCSSFNPYIKLFIDSPIFRQQLEGVKTETINQITQDMLKNQLCPLPPVNEQMRIVETFFRLLPFIEKYALAETQLTALNTSFPEALKKSILQEAVQGRLVPQDPNDEPASTLLERIRAEKQALVKAGKIKKDKHESVIVTRDKIPYEIPENWFWCTLNDVVIQVADIDHKMPQTVEDDGYPYISPLDFTEKGIDYDNAKKIGKQDFDKLSVKVKPKRNDIIFPRYGTIGVIRLVETDIDFLVSYSCCTIQNTSNMDYRYVYYVLKSPLIRDEINKYVNKTTQPNVGLKSIKSFLFPLPPLAEQKRIVAKIEELMQYCDKL